jgi:protein-S-isoprenylcysteine O-methyltransferase Ste14
MVHCRGRSGTRSAGDARLDGVQCKSAHCRHAGRHPSYRSAMTLRRSLQAGIRPSTTRSTLALWAKSLLNAVLFFAVFMVALPWGAHRLVPLPLPIPEGPRVPVAVVLFVVGTAIWLGCLDTFSRHGRGTPLPMDAPRHLVTEGFFAFVRNPIMVGELLVIWAEALYVASAGVVLYAAVISVAAHLSVVYVEEPELRRRFGERYEDYCRNVPRWLPQLRRHRRVVP